MKKRKIISIILVILLFLGKMPASLIVNAKNKEQETLLNSKERAVLWLKEQRMEDGSYGDDRLINDTCEALTILPEKDSDNEFLEYYYEDYFMDNDTTARYAIATKDQFIISSFSEEQNPDGGFGLTAQFESDVLDSMLVLEAYIKCYGKDINDSGDKLIAYFGQIQNPDGGWSYNEFNNSDTMLTARVGYDIQKYLLISKATSLEIEEKLKLTDEFLLEHGNFTVDQEHFQEFGYYYLYSEIRDSDFERLPSVQEFLQTQEVDGSFYENISDTVLAIRLLDIMEERSKIILNNLEVKTSLSTYVIPSSESSDIVLNGSISYNINKDNDLSVRIFVLDGKNIIDQTEKNVTLISSETEVKLESYTFTLNEDTEKEITVLTELYEDDKILAKDQCSLKVKQPQVLDDLTVSANVITGKDYKVNLSWNDVSNQERMFGYHVLRKKEGMDWETRSSWDGEEKVNVLNVYPKSTVRNCLKEWMEQTIDDSGEPAGKGLFDIDTVYISDFNQDPEKYLLDKDSRQYKYDVIFFGSHDENAFQDLSSNGYEETLKFVESGHGVLFGHDTIINITGNNHVQFCKFAQKLGIIPSPSLMTNTYIDFNNTKIDVVKDGYLTNYPWKLQGTLEVAGTHNYEEYVGGTLGTDVWMEIQSGYDIDKETGAKNNGYLFTNNQLAMIQTGHMAGEATDDERKILANTLFYLKQFTEKNSAVDYSFYDEESPNAPEVIMLEKQGKKNQCKITTNIHTEDNGTDYQYYIEGMEKKLSDKNENVKSNTVNAKALSGIRGYLIGVNESQEPMKELICYEEDGTCVAGVHEAEDGLLQYQTNYLEDGHTYYMHVYAVDWANNISEETVKEFKIEKTKETTELRSTIELDKTEVLPEENLTIHLTTLRTNGQGALQGELELLDEKENKIEEINSELIEEIDDMDEWTKDVIWTNKNLMEGTYYIRLSWYQDNVLVEQTTVPFVILKDGEVISQVTVNQKKIPKDSIIQVEDRIRNTSTNAMENDLNITFNVYDKEQNIVLSNIKEIKQLFIEEAKDIKIEFNLTDLEVGNYTLESVITQNSNIISTSTTKFEIQSNEKLSLFYGEINMEESEDIRHLIYSVTNQGDLAEEAEIEVVIVSMTSGAEMYNICSCYEFAKGEEKNYKRNIDISKWDEGDYLAILTATNSESNKVLDAIYFRKEKKDIPTPVEYPMLVATEKSIEIQCEEAELIGNLYAAENFNFNGSILDLNGKCSVGNEVIAKGWKINIAKQEEQATFPDIPDFSNIKTTEEKEYSYFNNVMVTLDKDYIQEDSIEINSDEARIGTKEMVMIASLHGDVIVNATNLKFNGIIYAPNGTVYLNISRQQHINGKIFAKEIRIQGSKIYMEQ